MIILLINNKSTRKIILNLIFLLFTAYFRVKNLSIGELSHDFFIFLYPTDREKEIKYEFKCKTGEFTKIIQKVGENSADLECSYINSSWYYHYVKHFVIFLSNAYFLNLILVKSYDKFDSIP